MKERIIRFESAPHYISFSFSPSAGIYQLPITHKDFVGIMTRVAKAYQDDSAVEVVTQGHDVIDIR